MNVLREDLTPEQAYEGFAHIIHAVQRFEYKPKEELRWGMAINNFGSTVLKFMRYYENPVEGFDEILSFYIEFTERIQQNADVDDNEDIEQKILRIIHPVVSPFITDDAQRRYSALI